MNDFPHVVDSVDTEILVVNISRSILVMIPIILSYSEKNVLMKTIHMMLKFSKDIL